MYTFILVSQLFIDYVHIISRIGELRETTRADADADASEISELETLTGRIPKLIGVLPDVLHNKAEIGERFSSAALSHMLSRLLDCVDPSVAVCLPSICFRKQGRQRLTFICRAASRLNQG